MARCLSTRAHKPRPPGPRASPFFGAPARAVLPLARGAQSGPPMLARPGVGRAPADLPERLPLLVREDTRIRRDNLDYRIQVAFAAHPITEALPANTQPAAARGTGWNHQFDGAGERR